MSTPITTPLYQFFEERLPRVFLGKEIDHLTNGILRWRTIQNQRSAGQIPSECFEKISARKVVILREKFLMWWLKSHPNTAKLAATTCELPCDAAR